MIEQTCKICGKKFMAQQSNYTICSETCREKNAYTMQRLYYYNNRLDKLAYSSWYNANRRISKRKGNPCAICGQPLPDSRAKYCLNCLFEAYQNGKRKWAYKVLVCRGYDLAMIDEEIAQMR